MRMQGLIRVCDLDVDVNFDLCEDDGAAKALFGGAAGQINGTAMEVDCGQWTGSGNLT